MQLQLQTFKKFNDLALAQNLVAILDENGIEYLLEESPVIFNPSFATRTEASAEYSVKINSEDFTTATRVLNEYESSFTDDVEPDHYLFDFTTAELMEIMAKPDEWSAFDYALAKKILNEKGVIIDGAVERKLNIERLDELKRPEEIQTAWLVAAYLSSLAGGVLGYCIGWYLWTDKKALPNGDKIYTYTEKDRKHGRRICLLSVICLLAILYYVLFYRK